jgi:hypothetical protein
MKHVHFRAKQAIVDRLDRYTSRFLCRSEILEQAMLLWLDQRAKQTVAHRPKDTRAKGSGRKTKVVNWRDTI